MNNPAVNGFLRPRKFCMQDTYNFSDKRLISVLFRCKNPSRGALEDRDEFRIIAVFQIRLGLSRL
jgi:hypothetical protein